MSKRIFHIGNKEHVSSGGLHYEDLVKIDLQRNEYTIYLGIKTCDPLNIYKGRPLNIYEGPSQVHCIKKQRNYALVH